MSGLGILAAGIGGGAQATGNISAGMIDQERRLQSAQALSDIDEAKWARIDEARRRAGREDAEYNTVGKGADNALAFAGRKAGVELDAKVAEASNPALRQAAIDTESARAKAKHAADREQAIADANDPAYIGAVTKLKLADPEVAQRIAASRAQVAASGASVGLIQAQTEGVKLGNEDKKALDKLYAEAGTILSDATIDDTERAKRYNKVSQQIVLMKSKNGQAAARDPELDTQTVTEEKINPDGSVTKVQRKEVRRPGAAGGDNKPPESTAHAQAQAAISAGADPAAVNKRLVEAGYAALPTATPPKKPAGILPAAAQPAPTAEADPLAGLSRSQIRDKRAELLADRQRWSGKPGADARLAEIDTLISRIDSGQY